MNAVDGGVKVVVPDQAKTGVWKVSVEVAIVRLDGTFIEMFQHEKNILASSPQEAAAESMRVYATDRPTTTLDEKSVPVLISSYRLLSVEWIAAVDRQVQLKSF